MKLVFRMMIGVIPLALLACQPSASTDATTIETANAAATNPAHASSAAQDRPRLQMKVDGVLWEANAEIFGAIDPLGLSDSLLISGSFGPNDASEQDFSMTLTGVSAPGRYRIQNAKPSGSVVQLGNFSASRYLIGGLMFEHDIEIELTQLQAHPLRIEGRFSGWMQANDGGKVQIRDGAFFYRE